MASIKNFTVYAPITEIIYELENHGAIIIDGFLAEEEVFATAS